MVKRKSTIITRLKKLTRMSIAIFRLTESIYTSLQHVSGRPDGANEAQKAAYNSSRQRIGEPIASHRASKRHICENDFSPPDRVFAPRLMLSLVLSGST